jgi:hypothetical protein
MLDLPAFSFRFRHLLLGLGAMTTVLIGCGATSDSLQADAAANSEGSPIKVYPAADKAAASPWNVQVANRSLPIEGPAHLQYARFQDRGDAATRVTLTLTGSQTAEFKIAPPNIKTEQHGNSVILELRADEFVRVAATVGGKPMPTLMIFRELDSFSPFAGSGRQRPRVFIDAPPAGTDPAHHTAAIQKLLDQASANEGSALVVRAGVHPIQGLVFKNDVTIYFEPGSVWKSELAWGKWSSTSGSNVLLNMDGARNITLAGYGVINAGLGNMDYRGPGPTMISMHNATNIKLQNLILRNEPRVRVEKASKVVLDHLRLLPENPNPFPQGIESSNFTDVEVTNLVSMQ